MVPSQSCQQRRGEWPPRTQWERGILFSPAPILQGSHWDPPGVATGRRLGSSPVLLPFGKAAEGKEVEGEDGSRNACCPVSLFSFSASPSLALNRLVIWRKSIVFCT